MLNEHDRPNLSARLPRFQFTIRSMLILTAVVAVLCSVFFAMPDWAGEMVIVFLACLVPSILVIVLTDGNRNQRAFGIGALFPSGFSLLWVFGEFHDTYGLRFTVVLLWALAILDGYLCVLTRRWMEKRHRTDKRAMKAEGHDVPPSPTGT
jgi:hypothetical protein